jgi:tetratricopeptide (TPR) repeat protein
MTDTQPGDNPVDDLAEEFARRWRDGERPSVEDYAARFPQWAVEIRDLFPAVLMMEQLKPRRDDHRTPTAPLAGIDRLPERLGDYRLLREIGHGGMGVVYEAEQEALGRRVAIKVLPAHLFLNEKLRSRFQRESQAAARLHHTNIVPVFGVGEQDGFCFYVMQLIAGRGIEATPGARSHQVVAGIGVQVADALAYAHSQGVLHRDVKPSNLLLDDRGAVWVSDFGVAKLVEEANLTQSGELVGTLKYMPPERFLGQSDARGDVYSLGITLYELLAGRPAFSDTTPHHLIHLITHAEPPPLRSLVATIPADLETIVLKAAARDPAHRYQTAAELADDLRRFLDDRPILARRVGPVEQIRRWCGRNRVVAGLAAAAVGLLLLTSVVSAIAYFRTAAANRETADANTRMKTALAAEQAQREHAEKMSASALETLNHVYERFAPSRIVVTPGLGTDSATDEEVDLPSQPVLSPQAVRLLEELLGFYEQLAQEGGDYPKLRAQAAEANQRSGDIHQRLGQFEQAIAAYRKAVELYTGRSADGLDEAVRVKVARTYSELGRALQALQRTEEARQASARALATLNGAPKELAARPEYRYELARTYYFQGPQDLGMGPPRPPGPEGFGPGGPRRPPPSGRGPGPPAQRAIPILEGLVKEYAAVPEYRHLLACCYRDQPPDRVVHEPVTMGEGAARAIELLRQLVKDFRKVPDYRQDLCTTLVRVSFPGLPQAPVPAAAARPLLEEAVALADELAAEYPNVPQYTAARAQAQEKLGRVLQQLQQAAPAEKALRLAVTLQTGLVKQHAEVVAYNLALAQMQASLARFLSDRGNGTEARTLFETSVARLEELRRQDPRLGFVRGLLGREYRELALVLTRAGEKEAAAMALRKAEALGPGRGPEPFGPRERRGDR